MSILFLTPQLNNKYFKLSCECISYINQKLFSSPYLNRRFFNKTLHESNSAKPRKSLPFADVMKNRRKQASHSILVQVQSAQSFKELYSYCSMFGNVQHMFHFASGVEPLHFILVEFSKENDVKNILSASTYVRNTQIIPVQSIFLWFKASSKQVGKFKYSKTLQLQVENGTETFKEGVIKLNLQNATSISDQITLLYEMKKLNDVGTRLRYLVAKQIESAISGMFPSIIAYPFGSSVNGYGKMGCDLDLSLKFNDNVQNGKNENRLVFHCKEKTSHRYMETIADILHLYLPGSTYVRKILQARVPIIKYHQQFVDVECDLSMVNISGVYMSEFLYLMGEIDNRVRPLVFTIKEWASNVGLTNSSPGRWITNFSLTLLVIAFLQNPGTSPILPTFNELVKQAGPTDVYVTDDGINCTFLRNVNKLNFKTENNDDLQSLLQQFFEYYSQFDYENKAVCLNERAHIPKPDHSALYIVNPLERGLNVSKNVILDELLKFKVQLRNALWVLDSEESKKSNWGLLCLFKNINTSKLSKIHNIPVQGKLIEVSKLFEDDIYDKSIKQTEYERNESVAKLKTEKTK